MQASLLASRRVSGFRPVDRTGTPSPLQGEGVAAVPFGIAAIDNALGGGLLRAALHEIAAACESATAAASGFALAVAARIGRPRAVAWIAEDMGFIENGALGRDDDALECLRGSAGCFCDHQFTCL